ncbi:MAG TPA: NADP-dependent oxidoreductase [Chitinophagaceae bacterium]|nr:NADP-dependent oxidoreductase [Chitinophagaceae bacterium]
MKAIRIYAYGGPNTLKWEEAPVPEPGLDELLIRVHSAAVNPIDWKIRQGRLKEGLQLKFPFILGWDMAGTVEKTGKLVSGYAPGDKVFARPDTSRNGCYAEFALARVTETAYAPKSIPLEEAAGVPLAAQTAWEGLFEKGGLQRGQRVLILGASGGVGSFAVQLARIAEAEVIATTSEKNIDFIRSLGANEVINYQSEESMNKIQDIDLVFDTVGGEAQKKSWDSIRSGGMLVSISQVDTQEGTRRGIRTASFYLQSNGARLSQIASWIDAGKLKVVIEKEFSLQDVAEAHALSEQGHARGKIILRIE